MEQPGIFREGRALHAERATDIAGQHAHLVGLDVQEGGHLVLQPEHTLVAGVERVAVGSLVVVRRRRARFHGADDDAVADQAEPRHVSGLGEGVGHLGALAVGIVDADVAGRIVEHDRCAGLGRLARIGDGGQRLDIEHHRFGRVLGLRHGFGNHEGHRVADEAHLVGGERMARRRLHRRAVAVGHRDQGLECAIACGVQISAGPHAEHAGHFPCFSDVDAFDDSVRDLAAHHHGMCGVGQLDVIAVAALALQQGRVFLARHRLADAEFEQVGVVGDEGRVHGRALRKAGGRNGWGFGRRL